MSSSRKSKGSRRRVERELLAMRDEAEQQQLRHASSPRFYGRESHRQRLAAGGSTQGSGSLDGRRNSEDSESPPSNNEQQQGRGTRSVASVVGASATTEDSNDEEEGKAPPRKAPAPKRLSLSARLALAERALAEVMAQRDDALKLLESSRHENAKLRAELDRAKSYKALYAAAHHEHQGMKASLAASTEICMGQQKLIQMLQQTSSAPPSHALDPEELLAGPGGGAVTPPPPVLSSTQGVGSGRRRRRRDAGDIGGFHGGSAGIFGDADGGEGGEGDGEEEEEEEEEADDEETAEELAAAAVALAQTSKYIRSRGLSQGDGRDGGRGENYARELKHEKARGGGGDGDGYSSQFTSRTRKLITHQRRDRSGSEARRSTGVGADGVDGGSGDTTAAAAAAAAAESVRQTYVRSTTLFPDSHQLQQEQTGPSAAAAQVSEMQAVAMRAASSVARDAAIRERIAVNHPPGGGGSGGGGDVEAQDGGRRVKSGSAAAASLGGRLNLLDDDLISHSSLRREYDETFLNQPLRGGRQKGWTYSGGDEEEGEGRAVDGPAGAAGRGVEDVGAGEDADVGAADTEAQLAGMARARSARNHLREKGKTKSGSQSSVSTVASTTKSGAAKAPGSKEERGGKKGRSERGSARDGDHKRGTSPRPSAPRQARTSQRLSSRTSYTSSSAAALAGGPGVGGGAAGVGGVGGEMAREGSSRRGSGGSSGRLSSRKR